MIKTIKITKRFFIDLASIALVSIGLTSCVQDSLELSDGTASLIAYTESNDTKSVLDGNVSKWKGEESIQVIGRKGSYKFSASVNGESSFATFNLEGSASYDETEVMAVYPYSSGEYTGDLAKKTVTGVTIPSVQNAVAGSYDPMAAVAVAHSTDSNLKFKNAVSLLKFTMGSSGVKNVTIWGDMSQVEVETEVVQEGMLYLQVPNEWKSDNAWFAAYFFGKGDTWRRMTPVAGNANLFSCERPSGFTSVIFVRMNPNSSALSWDVKWNQTVDIALNSNNLYKITDPWGTNGKGSGIWSSYTPTSTSLVSLGVSGTGTVAYNGGDPQVTGFSTGYVSLNGDFKRGKTYYIAVAPVVFENGFTMEFSDEGDYNKYKVKSTSKRVEFKRNTIYDLGTVFSGKDTGFYTEPAMPNADGPCTIYYTAASEEDSFYGYTGDVYVHIWLRNGAADTHGPVWGTNTEKFKMKPEAANTWSLTMEPSIREWFSEIEETGSVPVQRLGILARSADGKTKTEDNFISVVDDVYGAQMPEGLHHGINYIDNSTVTLVLYDRDNTGRPHDFCNLLWDDNWWGYEGKAKKPLCYDDESGCWWITLKDLNPNMQYKFQYQLGKGSAVTVTTFDPYTEILYDRSNDQWISSSAYPGLAEEYGDTHYGRDNGFVSAFRISKDNYSWEIKDYDIEDDDDLIIYELLLRDFTDNSYGEGNINAAMKYLDYLDDLGVNAIELMPVQEFDGNNSWGYGTHAYFALDKVYGNRNAYKKFIDECHKRGMAVIFDVVYNHATGAHPYAAMYWDGDKTASNNPWFNRDATHKYNVYHQWNHSNPMVRDHVKRNLEYLIKEYKVDGFRFDLSKGFTQDAGKIDSYNSERVGYLKEYREHIRRVDPDAVMICEHFVEDENYDLGHADIKVWRNMNEAYSESCMGWMNEKTDFDGLQDVNVSWLPFGTLVGYMESHDEERTMFKAKEYGTDGVKASESLRLRRAGLNAAFFLLVPGPKMIWQFGEIGYDYSIFHNDDRTGKKPWVTDAYMADPDRKALYDTYAMLLKFRHDNPRFFDNDVNFRWYVDPSHATGRYLYSTSAEGKSFALFGNFGTGRQTISVELPTDGTWYQYDNGAEWKGRNHSPQMDEGQFYILVNDKSLCRK